MSRMTEPLSARSLLFAPGDSPRKLEKAGLSAADLVIIDLEDAVAESAKPDARMAVAQHLKTTHRRQPHWVRINPLDTPHALPDLAAIVASRPDGVMLPKATRADADRLNHYLERAGNRRRPAASARSRCWCSRPRPRRASSTSAIMPAARASPR